MNRARGFTLVEVMIVVAILGILAAIAIPQYLDYMSGAKRNSAIENFDVLARAAKAEATKRNLPAGDGPVDVLVLVDPGYAGATAKKSPMDNSIPAYAQAAAPTGDGQVVVDVIDFSRATSPRGTVVTIRADASNDGFAATDLSCQLTLE